VPFDHDRFTSLRHIGSGKVREIFAVDPDSILIVATDRISAFDVVLPTEIPDKGTILTQLSLWWFRQLADLVPNHLLTADVEDYPANLAGLTDDLRGRSMLCRKLSIVPLECVARGYLAGSALVDYQHDGATSGHRLPAGLRLGSQLPEPIFAPATKAPVGEHDENIAPRDAARGIGAELVAELERLTLAIYGRAAALVEERGLVLADTKFEFGHAPDGRLYLADEVLTPDSSRFWKHAAWQTGAELEPLDKQIIRNWLIDNDRVGQPAELPAYVVDLTRELYIEVYETITGLTFDSAKTTLPGNTGSQRKEG
jgi:phosphoribosylaminoimidazole-succinocarboxamide synthase